MHVAHRVDHRQDGARENAVLACRRPARDLDLDVAELVDAAAVRRARRCVGDEGKAASGGHPREPHGLVREMVTVDDHLHHDVRARKGDADDAGVALAERAHRVEEVRDRRHTEIECLV